MYCTISFPTTSREPAIVLHYFSSFLHPIIAPKSLVDHSSEKLLSVVSLHEMAYVGVIGASWGCRYKKLIHSAGAVIRGDSSPTCLYVGKKTAIVCENNSTDITHECPFRAGPVGN